MGGYKGITRASLLFIFIRHLYEPAAVLDGVWGCVGESDRYRPCPRRASRPAKETNLHKCLLIRISRLEAEVEKGSDSKLKVSPHNINPHTLFLKNGLHNNILTHIHPCAHTFPHSDTHSRDMNGCYSGPRLCHCRIAGKQLLKLPCSGSLLLPELIYSKDHLGTENNVLSYLNDRPY